MSESEFQYSDKELIEQFSDPGQRNRSFNLLVRKYQKQVYKVVRRIILNHDDTNDIVQDVFIKVYNSLAEFRSGSSLFTWMYRIATNESLNFIRKKKIRQFFSFEDLAESTDFGQIYEMGEGSNETEKIVLEAIHSLPEKQRIVFQMRYYDEMKYEDMAKILKTSEGGLKANYHHAVKKIEAFVKNKLNF